MGTITTFDSLALAQRTKVEKSAAVAHSLGLIEVRPALRMAVVMRFAM